MSLPTPPTPPSGDDDAFAALRPLTPARIALSRTGASLPTAALLALGIAHAQARDAVHAVLDVPALRAALQTAFGLPVLGALSEIRSEAVIDERKRDVKRLALAGAALLLVAAFYVYWEVVRLPAVAFDGAATASIGDELARTAGEARRERLTWD